MALIVEDGTGITNANGLVSVEFVDQYASDRGASSWEGTDEVKGQAIIRATDYMELLYRDRWKGDLAETATELSWPRTNLLDRKGEPVDGLIPSDVKKACAEYSMRALTTILLPDPTLEDGGKMAARVFEKVGPLEVETEFLQGYRAILRKYPVPDRLLADWIYGSTRTGGVIR